MPNGLSTLVRDTGDIAQSFEYMFDINTGTKAAPVWLNVPELTGLTPVHAPVKQDASVYADQGTTANRKTGSDFTIGFNLLKRRNATTGEFQATWLKLKDAADGDGDKNELEIRYYDSRGAADAYRCRVAVSRDARPETGNAGVGWEAFSFTSVERAQVIVNPLKSV